MTNGAPKVLYTAAAEVEGGRGGSARSSSGRLAVQLSRPTDPSGAGTNPEELFAAGHAACFDSAVAVAASRLGQRLAATTTSAEVDLVEGEDRAYALRVRLEVRASGVEQERLEEVVALADRLCPYSNAIRGNVAVDISAVALT